MFHLQSIKYDHLVCFLESPTEVSSVNYSILSIRKFRPKEIKSVNMPGTLPEAKSHG